MGQKLVVSEQEQVLLEASHGSGQDRPIELPYDDAERHIEAIRSGPGWSWPPATCSWTVD
jgi:hypothetical protein